jgi:hypothetical protein
VIFEIAPYGFADAEIQDNRPEPSTAIWSYAK